MPVKRTLKNNRKQRKIKNNRKTKRRLNKKRNLNLIKGGAESVIFNQDCNYNFKNTYEILKNYFENKNWITEYNEYKKTKKLLKTDDEKKKQCTELNKLDFNYTLFNHFHYPNTPRSFFTYTKDSIKSNDTEMQKLIQRIGNSISHNETAEIPIKDIKEELFKIMNICEYFIDAEKSTNSSTTEITPPSPK